MFYCPHLSLLFLLNRLYFIRFYCINFCLSCDFDFVFDFDPDFDLDLDLERDIDFDFDFDSDLQNSSELSLLFYTDVISRHLFAQKFLSLSMYIYLSIDLRAILLSDLLFPTTLVTLTIIIVNYFNYLASTMRGRQCLKRNTFSN